MDTINLATKRDVLDARAEARAGTDDVLAVLQDVMSVMAGHFIAVEDRLTKHTNTIEVRLTNRIDTLETKMDTKFDEVNDKLNKILAGDLRPGADSWFKLVLKKWFS